MKRRRQRLYQERDRLDLSQEDVAEYLGISRPMFTDIENAESDTSIENWELLENLTGVPYKLLRKVTESKCLPLKRRARRSRAPLRK